jgi:hypothetical protein
MITCGEHEEMWSIRCFQIYRLVTGRHYSRGSSVGIALAYGGSIPGGG